MTLYIAIFLGTMALSLWASWRVNRNFRHYSTVPASSGLTGAQAAARVMQAGGVRGVEIVAVPGELTDHYDPLNKRLALCEANYYGNSVAAVGVAAHEAGHAIQHALAYAPLNMRMAAVGITTKAGILLPLIALFGYSVLGTKVALMALAACAVIIMLFQLITLPVEFDATARAKRLVGELNLVYPGAEREGMDRVLDAAALTYVAAFISSVGTLVYYAMQLSGLGRSEE
jgi:hypothetical protein